MKLEIRDRWIEGAGVRIKSEYPVLRASLVGDRVLVIYDWMAFPRKEPARNLFCYDKSGAFLWRAPDIGFGAVDVYTNIQSEDPLWVGNFACVNCRINAVTGEVEEQVFTK